MSPSETSARRAERVRKTLSCLPGVARWQFERSRFAREIKEEHAREVLAELDQRERSGVDLDAQEKIERHAKHERDDRADDVAVTEDGDKLMARPQLAQ